MIDKTVFENKIAAYYTLGCKLNFAETSTIGKVLAEQGVRKARPGEKADICVVNTCSVTELADKKCRQAIRRIGKQHPGAFIVVTGCYAQLKPEEVSHIEGVDLVLGAEQKLDLLMYLDDLKKREEGGAIIASRTKDIRTFSPSCSADDRTRHFLKVQDGCDYFCSYCTIPFARGRSRNGTIASMVKQAEEVASNGGKEIVLTGVNIGDFGKSTGETFIDLIRALDEVEGIVRYRISSIEPNLLTDEIIAFCATSPKFQHHFHIPLQSGSDKILGLNIGADDYITKPFSMEELTFRIEAILRRVRGKRNKESNIYKIGRFTFDTQKQILSIDGKNTKLTTKESELLGLLCAHANEILQRDFALKTIWIDDNYFNARSMDVYITKLRKHLKEDDSIEIINIHGKGYKLITPEVE